MLASISSCNCRVLFCGEGLRTSRALAPRILVAASDVGAGVGAHRDWLRTRRWALPEHTRAKGKQREFRHLECLQSEGDADDGDAVDRARDEVARRHGQAGAEEPDDVGDERGCSASVLDGLAKRRERERRHLKRLAPQRDTDDADAEQASHEEPIKRGEDAAEEHPDDVAEQAHKLSNQTVTKPTFIVRSGSNTTAYGRLKGWMGGAIDERLHFRAPISPLQFARKTSPLTTGRECAKASREENSMMGRFIRQLKSAGGLNDTMDEKRMCGTGGRYVSGNAGGAPDRGFARTLVGVKVAGGLS